MTEQTVYMASCSHTYTPFCLVLTFSPRQTIRKPVGERKSKTPFCQHDVIQVSLIRFPESNCSFSHSTKSLLEDTNLLVLLVLEHVTLF